MRERKDAQSSRSSCPHRVAILGEINLNAELLRTAGTSRMVRPSELHTLRSENRYELVTTPVVHALLAQELDDTASSWELSRAK